MRALYLFINGLASSNPERRADRGVSCTGVPDDELVPIRPGAFARWMTARDASSAPVGHVSRRPRAEAAGR